MLTTLPDYLTTALFPGLQALKVKGTQEKVATLVDVGAPQVTPDNSPLGGQVAVAKGSPVEPFIKLIIDTSAYTEAQLVSAFIGNDKASRVGCSSCPSSTDKALVYINSQTCDQYEDFLNLLCSTPYTFNGYQLTVKPSAGAAANPTLTLPERVKISHLNLHGEGFVGTLFPSLMENKAAYPRTNEAYVAASLVQEQAHFGRNTLWEIPNLQGKRIYELTLFTAFRKEN